MISASIGSHRFNSGPTFHFNALNFKELCGVVNDPAKTVEYVNTLRGVDATPQEMRDIAASGITRLALGCPNLEVLRNAGNTLVNVSGGGEVDRSKFMDRLTGDDIFRGARLENQILDSASVISTRMSRPEETASIIRQTAPADEGYFVIGLANGGLITAARTYRALGEGINTFAAVRFSKHKSNHNEPGMHPYPQERKAWLQREAKDKQVVVVDEDHTSASTLNSATEFFGTLLDKPVMGIAPVHFDRYFTYDPLIVKSK